MPAPPPRLRDPLGLPVWVLVAVVLLPPWVLWTFFTTAAADPPYLLPRIVGVYGYDGFVHELYERSGSRIPPMGGRRGEMIPLAVLAAVVLSACVIGPGRPRRRNFIIAAAGVPWWLLALALIALALNMAGWWDGWIAENRSLRHYGQRVARPIWTHTLPLMAGAAIFVWLIVSLRVTTKRNTTVDLYRPGYLALISAVSWGVTWLPVFPRLDLHSTRILCEITLCWCLIVQLIRSARLWRKHTHPIGVTRGLLLNPRIGEVVIYALMFGTGPVTLLAGFYYIRQRYGEGEVFLLALLFLACILPVLQWVHVDMRRFKPDSTMKQPLCPRCRYDLRGTVAAERRACPECGEPVSDMQFHWLREHLANLRPESSALQTGPGIDSVTMASPGSPHSGQSPEVPRRS